MCICIIIIFSATFGFWVMKHGVQKRDQIRKEKIIYSKVLKDIKRAESNLKYLREALKADNIAFKVVDDRIGKAGDIGKFLKKIDFMIKQRKIDLITFQPRAEIKEKYFSKVPVQMVFNGTFADIFYFLYDLETMGKALIIKTITISKSGIDGRCRCSLTFDFFQH